MGRLLELGERMELVSMDPHFHDISIALYHSRGEGGAAGFLAPQLQRQGGRRRAPRLRDAGDGGRWAAWDRRRAQPGRLAFACGDQAQGGGEAALPRGLQAGAGGPELATPGP